MLRLVSPRARWALQALHGQLIRAPASCALCTGSRGGSETTRPGSGAAAELWDGERGWYDSSRVESALRERTEAVAEAVLGEANEAISSARELRYGSKGSLVVRIEGDRRGSWYDFEAGEGGSLLNLIQRSQEVDFKGAIDIGVALVESHDAVAQLPPPGARAGAQDSSSRTRDYAGKLVRQSAPITGTLAERYLRQHRRISRVDSLSSFRFHPGVSTGKSGAPSKLPALLALARELSGPNAREIRAIQAVYLDPNTAQKASGLAVSKRTYGSLRSAAVTVKDSKSDDKLTFVAEGVETALSIAAVARGRTQVLATLGKSNFKNIALPGGLDAIGRRVVLCLDNDGQATFAHRGVADAIAGLTAEGREVLIATPDEEGTDFNDILVQAKNADEGTEAIMRQLSAWCPWDAIPELRPAVERAREQAREQAARSEEHLPGWKDPFSGDSMVWR